MNVEEAWESNYTDCNFDDFESGWNAAIDEARKTITQSSKGYPDEMVEEFVMELEKLKS